MNAILDNFRLALGTFVSHPLRSILTLLGIVIGATTVVAMMGLLEGLRIKMTEDMSQLGTNSFQIQKQPERVRTARLGEDRQAPQPHPRRSGRHRAAPLRSPRPPARASRAARRSRPPSGRRMPGVLVWGATPQALLTNGIEVGEGRFYEQTEEAERRRVAVIGADVADVLFPGEVAAREVGAHQGPALPGDRHLRAPGRGPDGRQPGQLRDDPAEQLRGAVRRCALAQHQHPGAGRGEHGACAGGGAPADAPAPRTAAAGRGRLRSLQQRERHADARSALDRGHLRLLRGLRAVPDRRRDRHPEHHAGERDRADPGDRHPQGAGGPPAADPRPVRHRGHPARPLRRDPRGPRPDWGSRAWRAGWWTSPPRSPCGRWCSPWG